MPNDGRFLPGQSGNPNGRPRKIKGRLSFTLPIDADASAMEIARAITRVMAEAAAGKRPLDETSAMIKIMASAQHAKMQHEKHEIDVKAALIRTLRMMLQNREEINDGMAEDELRELIKKAKDELAAYTPPK